MMRDIGKNIRELRLRAGFSQDELAERLFVTRQTVSNYENGRTRPDVEQILHLAEIFGADANAVLYGPPVPESRRRAVSRAVVGGGMTAMLWTGFLLLRRWVTALVTYNYQILPGVILSVCWKPLMWGVTGWTLSQLFIAGHLYQTAENGRGTPGAAHFNHHCFWRHSAFRHRLRSGFQHCLPCAPSSPAKAFQPCAVLQP